MTHTHFRSALARLFLVACLFLATASVAEVAHAANTKDEAAAAAAAGGNTPRTGGNSGGTDGGGGGGSTSAPLRRPPSSNLILLQPLDDATRSLSPAPGIQIFFDYFNLSWPWILGVSAGLAVLQAMVGGMQIMSSSQKNEGKGRMMWATAGLLIIALAGTILSTINPLFYK